MTDKFITPADLPTEYERELLVILMEECNEIAQRASKILRFGALEVQKGHDLDNVQRMCLEIGDVQYMIRLLCDEGLISHAHIETGAANKARQLAKFLQTSKPVKEKSE